MKSMVAVLGLVLGLSAMLPHDACAAPGARLRAWANSTPTRQPMAFGAPAYPSDYGPGYRTTAELYPKYYGSFHYRHLDNIGIPTGDIGLRGNGLYMSPW